MVYNLALGASLSALLLSACASNRVDFGGVMSPVDVPVDSVRCARSDWRNVERVEPVYPPELSTFLYMRQDRTSLQSLQFNFDVDETGSTANIRFREPVEYTRHATMRKAILASAEAIAQWRYETDGEAVHAAGCRVQMDFLYQSSPAE